MLIDNLNEIPETLTEGVRCILLIQRNKDGSTGDAQSGSIKRISNGTKEWREEILELQYLRDKMYPNHRIYSSVNERSMFRAIFEFKRRQLEVDFPYKIECHVFYSDIHNRFFSCLANPNCREDSKFTIDCDDPVTYDDCIAALPREHIILDYETKNGRHLITHPFNPADFPQIPRAAIHKDALAYIG